MKHSTLLTALCAALFLVMIGWAPESVFAQHGGHGGGGGFHGGGGGFHGGGFHGGGVAYRGGGWQNSGGSWHGGGGSWHGGGGSWHGGGYHGGGYYGGGHYHGGGYWGYPGYGYGWGFSIGFNWGPFWGGFGYPYGYAWAPPYYPYGYPYAYPYPYPYYVPATPAGYADPSSSSSNGYAYVSGETGDYDADDPSAQQSSAPAQRFLPPAPQSAPAPNPVSIRNASYTPSGQGYATHAAAAPGSYRPSGAATRQLPPLRPAVQNVIRALRAMPPAARERQLDSGRYSNLTPKELEIVRYAADLPQS